MTGLKRLFTLYLMLTVFLCGASVMIIEIAGSRIIAPFFGSSIFIWSAVISVTLLSLAVGYLYGGRMADKVRTPNILYAAILIAGLYLILALLIKNTALGISSHLGLRVGALVSSFILFALPLLLLGTVSPLSVKFYTTEIKSVGSHVGVLYSLSTMGSFLGTLLAGFVLVPLFGISKIMIVTGVILIIMAVLYFILFLKSYNRYFMLIFLGAAAMMFTQEGLSTIIIGNTVWQELYKTDSFYGRLKVVEVNGIGRYIIADGVNQGGVDLRIGLSATRYPCVIDILSDMACPGMKRALVIGLGSGVMPNSFSKRGIATDVVDIDPKIVNIYKKYFSPYGDAEKINIFVEDGRCFVREAKTKYDVVVMDIFLGDSSPWHLMTLEAFGEVRRLLTDQGVLLINFIGMPNDKDGSRMIGSIHKTLSEIFPHVYTFNKTGLSAKGAENIFFMASLSNPSLEFPNSIPITPSIFIDEIKKIIGDRIDHAQADAFVLTDDYNPVEFYNARTKEVWRRSIMKLAERKIMQE